MLLVSGQVEGVCDRLTMALYAYRVGKLTGRDVYFHWPRTPRCNCAFQRLFVTDKIAVSEIDRYDRPIVGVDGGISAVVDRVDGPLYRDKAVLQLSRTYCGHNFDEFDSVFSPSDEVQELAFAYLSRSRELWRQQPIGVHVRRTDKAGSGPPKTDVYFRAIEKAISGQRDIESPPIFLATDDPECVDEFRARYGDRLMTYPVRTLDRDSTHGIIDAVVTLYLLRATRFVVGGAYSGYSLCAGWDNGLVDVGSERTTSFGWEGEVIGPRPIRNPDRPATGFSIVREWQQAGERHEFGS